jgi:Uma2 family endonuclease
MSTASLSAPALLTAEQFAERPDPGYPEELVKGRVVPMAVPKPRHGEICVNAVFIFNTHVKVNDLGRIVGNDSGVITERGPDTVRGADLAFYSFARVPKGPLPDGYLEVPPDLIVEVLSPTDRWPKVLTKVVEYLDAGVFAVIVLDGMRRRAQVFTADDMRILGPDDELTVPEVLPGFVVAVRRFFE